MFKKLQLTIIAAMLMTCSVTYGQGFTPITPSSLGLVPSQGPVTGTFNIGTQFGQAANAVQLLVANANVASGPDLFTVSDGNNASFTIVSNQLFDGFIQHGGVLGSPSSQTGSASVDGFFASPGETYTLVSSLDADYQASVVGNNNSVTYIGPDTGNVESNSSAFRFESNQPVSTFQVFTQNTGTFDSNFAVGFRPTAVPEPTAAVVLALGSTLCMIRRKRS